MVSLTRTYNCLVDLSELEGKKKPDQGRALKEHLLSLSKTYNAYQTRDPEDWYSVTRVSKKFFSFAKSIVSETHGNGFLVLY